MAQKVSSELNRRALRSMSGGVNSPVRAFKAVGAEPLFVDHAAGAYIYDADGNKYIDYLQSWGASILGHANPLVTEVIQNSAKKGTSYGLSTALEAELAELIKRAFPSIELLRMVNSGTEAVMSAVRLARGYTGRTKVLKFEGCYHGHSDGLLAKAGSGITTFSVPDSAGVPQSIASETLIVPYNDLEAARKITEQFADDIACILIEPVAANMGVIPPAEGFLEGLRKLCDSINALLIFDEVITGFRVAPGGAQEKYGIQADLTTLGKIIGGGLPVGAFGGRTEIMKFLAPDGPVYQAGTLSGNPVVASAGIAVLNTLIETNPYEELDRLAGLLEMKLKEAFEDVSLPVRINRVGSMLTVFFCENPVSNYSSARTADTSRYASFFRAMQKSGILFPPSQFEAAFLSTAHAIRDIEKTITPLKKWLQKHKN